jgi:hypothetical protein
MIILLLFNTPKVTGCTGLELEKSDIIGFNGRFSFTTVLCPATYKLLQFTLKAPRSSMGYCNLAAG